MPIYSANRVGTVEKIDESAKSEVVNEFKSLPEILIGINTNAMNFFEAVIVSDLNNIKAISEGTVLESDVVLLEEEIKKTAKEKIVDAFKSLWKWLSELYDKACDAIAKAIAEIRNHRLKGFMDDINNSGISINDLVLKLELDKKLLIEFDTSEIKMLPDFKSIVDKYANKENLNINEIKLEILCDAYGLQKSELNPYDLKSINRNMIDKASVSKNLAKGKSAVDSAEKIIKDNYDIRNIKVDKNKAKKALDEAIAEIKNSDTNINNLNTIAAAYQSALSARAGLLIEIAKRKYNDAIRFIGNLAVVANKMSKKNYKEEKDNVEVVNTESAIIECVELLNDATSLMPSVFFSDEIVAEAMKIVEDAEAAAEAEFCVQNK